MKKYLLWSCCVALLAAVAFSPVLAGQTYGEGVKGDKTVPLNKLLAKPEKYVDKEIRVEGTVGDVCAHMGCWIDIVGTGDDQKVRFKVKDGEIEFPVDAKGKHVVAEGVFVRVEMDQEQAMRMARHHAEERGEKFDPATAEITTSYYQIRGKGAVID